LYFNENPGQKHEIATEDRRNDIRQGLSPAMTLLLKGDIQMIIVIE